MWDRKQYDREFRKNYVNVTLNIRKDSGIPEALKLMTYKTGKTIGRYALEALAEKLIRERFLREWKEHNQQGVSK